MATDGKKSLRILLVDDDAGIVETVPADICAILEESGLSSDIDAARTVEDGLRRLEQQDYDIIVIDLRFGTSGGDGNRILRRIIEARVLPIIVFSAYHQELDPEFDNHGLIFLAPKKRAAEVAAKIKEWHEEDIFAVFSENGYLHRMLRSALQRTMWDHVSRYWQDLQTSNSEILARTAGRLVTTLVHDELSSSAEFASDSGEVLIHHGEIYIFRTPRRYLAVGDILRLDEDLVAVLTPACDLVPRGVGNAKSDVVLLADCVPLQEFFRKNDEARALLKNLTAGKDTKKYANAVAKIEKMMRHAWRNDDGRSFFLPPFAGFSGGVIDFLKVRTLPYEGESIEERWRSRILSLNREVAAELASRFARYMLRLGQSPFETAALVSAIRRGTEEDGAE